MGGRLGGNQHRRECSEWSAAGAPKNYSPVLCKPECHGNLYADKLLYDGNLEEAHYFKVDNVSCSKVPAISPTYKQASGDSCDYDDDVGHQRACQ